MATMAELVTQVRQRTELEASTFVTDQEIEDYLNDSIAELHTELLARWGDEYFISTAAVLVAANVRSISLVPAIITEPPMRYLQVLLALDDGKQYPLNVFSPYDTIQGGESRDWQTSPPRYKFLGFEVLTFDVAPSAESTVLLLFVPSPVRYDKDVAVQIRELYAWREFVIVDAMIKVFQKEESDTAALVERKQLLLSRISANAPPRDAAKVKSIVDDRSFQAWDWWDA